MAQPPKPAATPTLADRDSVAAASASAHIAVIGISQPKVTAAATPDPADTEAAEAAQAQRRVQGEHGQRPDQEHHPVAHGHAPGQLPAGSIPGP